LCKFTHFESNSGQFLVAQEESWLKVQFENCDFIGNTASTFLFRVSSTTDIKNSIFLRNSGLLVWKTPGVSFFVTFTSCHADDWGTIPEFVNRKAERRFGKHDTFNLERRGQREHCLADQQVSDPDSLGSTALIITALVLALIYLALKQWFGPAEEKRVRLRAGAQQIPASA
jgi:hypothetical protein